VEGIRLRKKREDGREQVLSKLKTIKTTEEDLLHRVSRRCYEAVALTLHGRGFLGELSGVTGERCRGKKEILVNRAAEKVVIFPGSLKDWEMEAWSVVIAYSGTSPF